jgi:hypothetical protein
MVHLGAEAKIIQQSGSITAYRTTFESFSPGNSETQNFDRIELDAGGSTFDHCTFTGGDIGLYVNNNEPSFNNIKNDTKFFGNTIGLEVVQGSVLAKGSVFVGNTEAAIDVHGDGGVQLDADSTSGFASTYIQNNFKGVNLYGDGYVRMKFTWVYDNHYGIFATGNSYVWAGIGYWKYAAQGFNSFTSDNYNDMLYISDTSLNENGDPIGASAQYNWWGAPGQPADSHFFGTVYHFHPLDYDPTVNGYHGAGSPSVRRVPQAHPSEVSDSMRVIRKAKRRPVTPAVRAKAQTRLSNIYTQLGKHPEGAANNRLLQQAYVLAQFYLPKAKGRFLDTLDTYILQIKSKAAEPEKQKENSTMGAAVLLIKLDALLREGENKAVQALGKQYLPYVSKDVKYAIWSTRAVAWQHQQKFGKALAVYGVLENMKPDPQMADKYVAPDYSFIKSALADSMKAYGQVRASLAKSSRVKSNNKILAKESPDKFSVQPPYPNPFNSSIIIPVDIPAKGNLKIVVYNILGQRIATLTNRKYTAGHFDIPFKASNLASGIYIIRIRFKNHFISKKVTYIR